MFSEAVAPLPATLARWTSKCNQEMERRVLLQFEIPLDEAIIADLPKALHSVAETVGKLEDGLTEGIFASEYQQTLDIYPLPESTTPAISMPNCQLMHVHIFRPLPKDGPSSDLFLGFSTTVRAEGEFGDQLVVWAHRHQHCTVYLRALEVQGRLALEEAETAATAA